MLAGRGRAATLRNGPRPQPSRNVLASAQYDCGSRLLRAFGHASRAAGRSDCDRLRTGSRTADGHDRANDTPRARTDRPRQPVDRRALRGRDPPRRRARSRPTDRSSSGPASTPAARRRTSSSSTSRRAEAKIWWGAVNRPITEAHYDRLRARLVAYCAERDLYSQDCFIGAAAGASPLAARLHRDRLGRASSRATSSAGRRRGSCAGFAPNFTIICVPSFKADPETEGTRTGTAILVHLERMEVIIVGTEYAGEIKKSAFTVMNYLMPDEGVLPMHSAINIGQDGDPAIFFGLSGTGKTTLSADPLRSLIGDDEHGWGDGHHLQLRGRLLRQDDPPVADVRARHLPDHAALRDGPRERRPRPARPARSISIRSGSPRTPAAPTRSTSSAMPTRPGIAGHAADGRSS